MKNQVTVITGTTISGVFKAIGKASATSRVVEGFKNMAAAQRYARDTSMELLRTYTREETAKMDADAARIRNLPVLAD